MFTLHTWVRGLLMILLNGPPRPDGPTDPSGSCGSQGTPSYDPHPPPPCPLFPYPWEIKIRSRGCPYPWGKLRRRSIPWFINILQTKFQIWEHPSGLLICLPLDPFACIINQVIIEAWRQSSVTRGPFYWLSRISMRANHWWDSLSPGDYMDAFLALSRIHLYMPGLELPLLHTHIQRMRSIINRLIYSAC